MSFQPVITLTALPRTSDSFTVIDATPTGGSTGYGSTNAPANLAAITSIYGQTQPYAEDAVPATAYSGNLTAGFQSTVPIRDGVNLLGVLFGEEITFPAVSPVAAIGITAISSDRLTLTMGQDYRALLGNVYALSIDGLAFPQVIKSISVTTIVLYTALPGTVTTATTIYRYYLATSTQLVLNQADVKIGNEIASLPLRANKCDSVQDTLDDLLLKFSSQAAYANQNYAKAHEAARLITADVTLPSSTCSTC